MAVLLANGNIWFCFLMTKISPICLFFPGVSFVYFSHSCIKKLLNWEFGMAGRSWQLCMFVLWHSDNLLSGVIWVLHTKRHISRFFLLYMAFWWIMRFIHCYKIEGTWPTIANIQIQMCFQNDYELWILLQFSNGTAIKLILS